MKKTLMKYIVMLVISLLLPILALQGVQANGVHVSVQYGNARHKITLSSQENGKGIRIVAYSPLNGKSINIAYAFDSKASVSDSIEIDAATVIAPFRVITQNTDNVRYRPFKDIINTEADEYICNIHDLGITSGFSDGTFKPDGTLTRAEAAVMLSTALNLDISNISGSTNKLKDINKHWAKKYINAVLNKNIMTGSSDNTFRPDSKITVAEVCTILSKSFSFKTKYQGVFTKLKKNQWYSPYVQNIFNMKILTPEDSIYKKFDEMSNISRGNFAIMLSRALSTY